MVRERENGKKICWCASLIKCSCRWTDRAFSYWDMDTLSCILLTPTHINMCFTFKAEMCKPISNYSVWLAACALSLTCSQWNGLLVRKGTLPLCIPAHLRRKNLFYFFQNVKKKEPADDEVCGNGDSEKTGCWFKLFRSVRPRIIHIIF